MSNLGLYVVTVLIWGSTWFAIEFQLGEVVPEVSVAYRYIIATSILLAWCRLRGLPMRFSLRQHGWFAAMGLLMFCLNYVLAYRAQLHITSALTAIAFSMIVWMNIINARLILGVRTGPRVLVGATLGVAGIVTLFAPEVGDLSLSDGVFVGLLLAVAGAYSASLGNIASQSAQTRGLAVVPSNAWGMLYGAVFSTAYAVLAGHPFTFELSASYVISLAYLAVFGSIVAFWAYLTLIGRIGAHRAGYATVLFPVVALLLSALFEGLEIDAGIIVGTGLVLLGNVFVLEGRVRRPAPRSKVSRMV